MSSDDLLDRIERKFAAHRGLSMEVHLGRWLVSLLKWIASEDCPGNFGTCMDVVVCGSMPGFPPMPKGITDLAWQDVCPGDLLVEVKCVSYPDGVRRWTVLMDLGVARCNRILELGGDTKARDECPVWTSHYCYRDAQVASVMKELIPSVDTVMIQYATQPCFIVNIKTASMK
jgi:hypothetical protein